jgi:hypothetical protein
MRSYFKASFVAVGLAAAVAAAAQPASAPRAAAPATCVGNNCSGPNAGGMRQARPRAMTPEQHAARFDSIAAQQAQNLQITATQRPLWDAYVQSKKNMFTARPTDAQRQDFARMTADERAEARVRHLEVATQHARQVANSTKALRNALTPEQRTRFDQMAMTGKHFGQGGRSGKRGGGMRQGAPGNVQAPATPATTQR